MCLSNSSIYLDNVVHDLLCTMYSSSFKHWHTMPHEHVPVLTSHTLTHYAKLTRSSPYQPYIDTLCHMNTFQSLPAVHWQVSISINQVALLVCVIASDTINIHCYCQSYMTFFAKDMNGILSAALAMCYFLPSVKSNCNFANKKL